MVGRQASDPRKTPFEESHPIVCNRSAISRLVRCRPRLVLVVALAAGAAMALLAGSTVARPKATAHVTKHRKACKLSARARRADARARRAISRRQRHIARLRRAGGRAARGAIRRDQRAIARLRRQLACQARVGAGPGLRIGLNAETHGSGLPTGLRPGVAVPPGVRYLREQFDWSVIEPAPGRYDWRLYDQLELTAAQRGFIVLPELMHAPSWAEETWDTVPADPAAFADFVAHVVARYGPGGQFWAVHPELASRAPDYFELWNEPYYPMYANGQVDPGRYARLVKAAGQAGRAANPRAKFIAAAETDILPAGSSTWVRWADGMYAAVPDLNDYFDAVAVHPYSKNRPPDAPINGYIHDKFQRIASIHQAFADHGGGDKPLWITEIGWSTCADPGQDCVSEDTQAAYISKLLAMVRGVYRDFVGGVFLYRTIDLGPPNSSDAEMNYGVARQDGAPKPAWFALRAAAALR